MKILEQWAWLTAEYLKHYFVNEHNLWMNICEN